MNLTQFVVLCNLLLARSSSNCHWFMRSQCVVGEKGPAVILHDDVENMDEMIDPRLDILVGVISSARISSAGRCIVFGTRISDMRGWIDKKIWQVILCMRIQIFQKQHIFTVIWLDLIIKLRQHIHHSIEKELLQTWSALHINLKSQIPDWNASTT